MRGFTPLIIVLVLIYSITPAPYCYLELPVIFVVMCALLFGRKGGKR